MPAAHGTFARAMSGKGCECLRCSRAMNKARNTTRAQSAKQTTRHLKLGQAVVTIISGGNERTPYALDDGTDGEWGDIGLAQVLGMSVRINTDLHTSLVMHKALYDAAMDDDTIVNTLQEFVSHLAGNVPKSTMKQVIDVSVRHDGRARYDEHLVRRMDMPEVLEGLRSLVGMLNAGEEPEKIMRSYGNLRDQVAQRRREFAEADELFATAQSIITQRIDL